ncbi:response regulator [Candidatus Poribacteria bacterium]
MDSSLHILLSDDEEIVHQTIVGYLRDLGHRVDGAYDGSSALRCIEERDYDVAIVDEKMPGMDGITLLAKAQEIRPDMPVIIITGHGTIDTAIQALRLGASEYLMKPIRLLELDTVLEKCARIRSLTTQRKYAEERLRESEEHWRSMAENAPNSISIVDRDGVIQYINRAVPELTMDNVIGKMSYDFVEPGYHKVMREAIEYVFETGKGTSYESQALGPGNSISWYDVQVGPVKQDGCTKFVSLISTDITQHRQMEAELLKAQKLESIATLVGGIAHDLNNLMIGITGNISLARMYENLAKKDRSLAEAEKASMQIRDLIQQLLMFSRGETPILQMADTGKLLRDSVTFALRGANVRCEFSIPDDLWPIEADEGQMNQVVSNLIINADQAMPEGGTVRIRAENTTMDAESDLPLEPGSYVRISIEDQGIGIPEEYRQRIFEPFFTTKQAGSGLGLTISRSIIQNHNGHITMESELGTGSGFHIHLPAALEQIRAEEELDGAEPATGRGKVLVMDDEPLIRELAAEMLTRIGYEVTTAIDGAEAIELYGRLMGSREAFDLVIMDSGDMGVKETIQKLLEADPGVRAIVSSGYPNDVMMTRFSEYGFRGVVVKPYKITELSGILNKIMTEDAL